MWLIYTAEQNFPKDSIAVKMPLRYILLDMNKIWDFETGASS